MNSDPFLTCLLVLLVGGSLIWLSYPLRALGMRFKLLSPTILSYALWIVGWGCVAAGGAVVFNVVLAPAVLLSLIFVAYLVGRGQQDALIGLLAATSQRGLPLAPSVRAFAQEQKGLRQQRLAGLADRLDRGVSLPEALAKGRGLVSAKTLLLLRVGHAGGRLNEAIRYAAGAGESTIAGMQAQSRLVYLVATVVAAIALNFYLMVKIMPAYQKIFEDFEVPPLPFVVETTRVAANYWFVVPLVLCAIAGMVRLWMWDLLPFSPPIVGRFTRRMHAARILQTLAMAVRAELPMTGSLEALARWYPRWPIRRRLASAAASVKGGRPWQESLLAAGLIGQADLAILNASQAVGNPVWALEELAQSSLRRFAYRAGLALQIAGPASVLACGLIVAIDVAVCFQSWVAITEKVIAGCMP